MHYLLYGTLLSTDEAAKLLGSKYRFDTFNSLTDPIAVVLRGVTASS